MRSAFFQLILYFLLFGTLDAVSAVGDKKEGADSLNKGRFRAVFIGKALAIGGSYWALDQAWYQSYPRGSFHLFDDSDEWLQMDKLGHFWAGHHMSSWSSSLWKMTGMKEKRAAWWGAGVGFFYLSGIEVMDGFSKGWGFSVSDAGANLLGAGSFLLQRQVWGKAYILPAFSYRPSPYASYRPELLGDGPFQRVLKDYNGQRYWLNIDAELFGEDRPFPDWLALSLGYGASGMLGGKSNPSVNAAGESLPSPVRHRRFFLSLDVMLRDLPVEGKGWRILFKFLDSIKLPFPTLEYNRVDGLRGHWLGP